MFKLQIPIFDFKKLARPDTLSKSKLFLSDTNVHFLNFIESSQDTSTCNTTQDVCTSSLHHRHCSFVLQDLHGAIDRSLVFHRLSRCHHHSSSDCIDGIRNQTRGYCYTIT